MKAVTFKTTKYNIPVGINVIKPRFAGEYGWQGQLVGNIYNKVGLGWSVFIYFVMLLYKLEFGVRT